MYDITAVSENQAPKSQPASAQGGGRSSAGLTSVLARIEEAVDTETRAVRSDPFFDLKASNARKSRYLYELTKAFKGMGEGDLTAEHREALQRLRQKLATNETVLQAHLHAVNEVASMLQDAIQRTEADGTYSAREFSQDGAA